MERSVLRNELFTKAVILGCVALLFDVAKLSLVSFGGVEWVLLLFVVALASLAVYGLLAYRFTRSYADLIVTHREVAPFFTYWEGTVYVSNLSMLAGIVVGFGEYLYLHYVVGYNNFVDAYIKLIQDCFSRMKLRGEEAALIKQELSTLFEEMQRAEAPSMISSVLGTVWSYLVLGAIVGLIVAAFTKRAPKLFYFDNNKNQPNNEQ